jgi:hypothetical protein
MHHKTSLLAATASIVGAFPAVAQAHVSLHPNAIPAGSFATMNLRVPDEEAHASTTAVRVKLPAGVLSGDVIAFPTVQAYSNGHVVRWIGAPTADSPAPTVDITPAGGALLDVTGGDAGPPSPLPANLTGASTSGAVAPAATILKKQNSGLAIVALIAGALGLILGAAALATRRSDAALGQ